MFSEAILRFSREIFGSIRQNVTFHGADLIHTKRVRFLHVLVRKNAYGQLLFLIFVRGNVLILIQPRKRLRPVYPIFLTTRFHRSAVVRRAGYDGAQVGRTVKLLSVRVCGHAQVLGTVAKLHIFLGEHHVHPSSRDGHHNTDVR